MFAAAAGAVGGAFVWGQWWLRKRLLRRRAVRLEGDWQGAEPTGGRRRPDVAREFGRLARRPQRWVVRKEVALPMLAGLTTAGVIGGPIGLLAGVLVGVVLRLRLPGVRTAEIRRSEHEEARLQAQLPLTAELLAACLSSSAVPAQATAVVARAVGGPMGERLSAVSAELLLGAPPVVCWGRLGEDCRTLAPLARCLVRTSVSGTPPAAPLIGLAVDQRAAAVRAARARVRKAGVLATAPLGLCFLPAFVLIGIVPVVVGLATSFTQHI